MVCSRLPVSVGFCRPHPSHHTPSGSGGADGGNVDEKYALFEKWRADGVALGPEAYKVMMWSLIKRAPSDPKYLQRAHAVLGTRLRQKTRNPGFMAMAKR
jgi:hypothetical protein